MIYSNASLTLIPKSPSNEKPKTYTGQKLQIIFGRDLPSTDAKIATARPKCVVRWHHGSPADLSRVVAVRIVEGDSTLIEGALDQTRGAPWSSEDWVQFLVF